jgi:hypothetical protein
VRAEVCVVWAGERQRDPRALEEAVDGGRGRVEEVGDLRVGPALDLPED